MRREGPFSSPLSQSRLDPSRVSHEAASDSAPITPAQQAIPESAATNNGTENERREWQVGRLLWRRTSVGALWCRCLHSITVVVVVKVLVVVLAGVGESAAGSEKVAVAEAAKVHPLCR